MKALARKIFRKYGFEINKLSPINDTEHYIESYGKESVKQRRFYNISAGGHYNFGGTFYHPCWTNIDVDIHRPGERNFDPVTDIAHDLLDMTPIPVDDATAELVLSQYSIEHISNKAADFMFADVKRILKSGGVFRVVCPNTELDYRAYKYNDRSFFYWENDFGERSFEQIILTHFANHASILYRHGDHKRIVDEEFKELFNSKSKEEFLEYCTSLCYVALQKKYGRNHINWWNHEKLTSKLKNAGFDEIYIAAPGQTVAPVFRNNAYFDILHNKVALFVEAIKK